MGAPVPTHKVALAPGHTLLDWARVKQSIPPRIPERLTREEVAEHSSVDDFWTIICGRVYDLTPFLSFHPGYEVMEEYAGQDMTHAFMEHHAWVNYEMLLDRCLVGFII